MTHSGTDDDLRDLIGGIVREHLVSTRVVDVLVCRDRSDDDDLLWVTVILEDAYGKLNDDETLSLMSDLQRRLAAEQEAAFPVISFSTVGEQEAAA